MRGDNGEWLVGGPLSGGCECDLKGVGVIFGKRKKKRKEERLASPETRGPLHHRLPFLLLWCSADGG